MQVSYDVGSKPLQTGMQWPVWGQSFPSQTKVSFSETISWPVVHGAKVAKEDGPSCHCGHWGYGILSSSYPLEPFIELYIYISSISVEGSFEGYS